MMLALSLPGYGAPGLASEDLTACRELRRSEPVLALEHCEQAARRLRGAGEADAAFEALMHAAELASHLGDPGRAEAGLDLATAILADVGDPLAVHRLARRRGLVAYRDRRPAEALGRFLEALAAARAAGDAVAVAVSDNDLGVVYRHLGDLPSALEHFRASLEAKESLGDADVGSSLANVGSLYRSLGDRARAREFLQRALQEHAQRDRALAQAHTIEELARLDRDAGDLSAARQGMDQAWAAYVALEAPRERQRLALDRAELERAAGDAVAAQDWLQRALALGEELQRPLPLRAVLLSARLAASDPERAGAYEQLRAAADGSSGDEHALQAEAQDLLADLAESLARPQQALAHLREARRWQQELAEVRHGERLDALRVRFDVSRLEAERDRLAARGALQSAELARQRVRTYLAVCAGLLALGLFGLLAQRRLYRQRLAAQRAQAALESRVAQARQAAQALRSDLRSMRWLLEQEQGAALVFDAAGLVRAINGAGARALAASPEAASGKALGELVGADAAAWAQSWVESSSLAGSDASGDGSRLSGEGRYRLRCRRLELEEELGVLLIEPVEAALQPEPVAPLPQKQAESAAAGAARADFRHCLVELMQASLEAWERHTRKTRIDLAEASGVWRITIDDGRLRVRAMDRYLGLDTLPERPRWREVLRTAYFVLAELDLAADQRRRLEAMIEEVLAAARRGAG
jgi:two-component system, sensor histidine kinase ChiS